MLKKYYLVLFFITGTLHNSIAQTITNYSFAASSGTFTVLSGATTATGTGSTVDEGHWNGIPIGFDFWYMGIRYTTVSPSTNGWITLGANVVSVVGLPLVCLPTHLQIINT